MVSMCKEGKRESIKREREKKITMSPGTSHQIAIKYISPTQPTIRFAERIVHQIGTRLAKS